METDIPITLNFP